MNNYTVIKRRLKGAGKKIAVASASAGAVFSVAASSAFAAVDTSATGPIGTALTQGKTDYEAIFGMLIASIVVFWALSQLKKVFFGN